MPPPEGGETPPGYEPTPPPTDGEEYAPPAGDPTPPGMKEHRHLQMVRNMPSCWW